MTISSWLNFGRPAPREGGLRWGETFGSALLQPARSVCVSSERFFHFCIFIVCCYHSYSEIKNFKERNSDADRLAEWRRSGSSSGSKSRRSHEAAVGASGLTEVTWSASARRRTGEPVNGRATYDDECALVGRPRRRS